MVDERLLDILESFGLSFPTNRLLKSEIAQKKIVGIIVQHS
jgi:hypothetical protein